MYWAEKNKRETLNAKIQVWLNTKKKKKIEKENRERKTVGSLVAW